MKKPSRAIIRETIRYAAAQYTTGYGSGSNPNGVRKFTGECADFAEEGFDDGRSHKRSGLASGPAGIVGRAFEQFDPMGHVQKTLLRIFREHVERADTRLGEGALIQDIQRTAQALITECEDDIPEVFFPFPEPPPAPDAAPTQPGLPGVDTPKP